jgi:hypothetical protein
MRHSELPNRHSKIPKFAGEPAIVDEVRAFQLNLRADWPFSSTRNVALNYRTPWRKLRLIQWNLYGQSSPLFT